MKDSDKMMEAQSYTDIKQERAIVMGDSLIKFPKRRPAGSVRGKRGTAASPAFITSISIIPLNRN